MYIVKKKNTYIHWWGKIIVLISNDEYYKLNDLETYLVQKIMRNNNSINVINSISNELEVDTCEAEEFVSIFLNNYDSIFEYKKQNKAMNILLSFKLDAPSPCRLDAPDLDLICYASADCLHQHLQVI